jgi:predicted DNA-binding ArsR family transcriptional regulator
MKRIHVYSNEGQHPFKSFHKSYSLEPANFNHTLHKLIRLSKGFIFFKINRHTFLTEDKIAKIQISSQEPQGQKNQTLYDSQLLPCER